MNVPLTLSLVWHYQILSNKLLNVPMSMATLKTPPNAYSHRQKGRFLVKNSVWSKWTSGNIKMEDMD